MKSRIGEITIPIPNDIGTEVILVPDITEGDNKISRHGIPIWDLDNPQTVTVDGFCFNHQQLLTYAEYALRSCFSCHPQKKQKR